MSYFDTIQGYMDNNNANMEHLKEVGNQFAEQKASTIKDKFDSVNGDIEKWGGALQGASSGWWMGRKIIRKIRTYTPDEKPTTQGGETDFKPDEIGDLDDVGKGAVRFADKPERDPDNPFNDTSGEKTPPKIRDDPASEPVNPEGTGSSVSTKPALEDIAEEGDMRLADQQEIADNISDMTSRAKAIGQRTQDAINRATNPDSANNPQEDPARGNEPDIKPDAEPEGTSGNDADALNETKPIANDVESTTNNLVDQGTKDALEDGTKAVVTNIAEKTGVKTGLDIAGETLADAVPVVGEVVAVGTLIAGLFKDMLGKHHNQVKQGIASLGGQSAGISQTAGMDTSAIASRVGAVAGLV